MSSVESTGASTSVFMASKDFSSSFKGALDEICQRIYHLASSVFQFVKRYQLPCITYVLSAVFMAGFATTGQMAQSIVPGFIWTLCNTKGKDLPEDFIQEGPSDSFDSLYWVPKKEEGVFSGALKERQDLMLEIQSHLETANEKGWALIHGPSGIGKTPVANEVLRRIAEKGEQKVYTLSPKIFEVSTKNPFLEVAQALDKVAKTSGSPPVLLVDEFQNIPFHLFSCLFQKPHQFNILAVMTTEDFKKSVASSDALSRRFFLGTYALPPLDNEAVCQTLKRVKKTRFSKGSQVLVNDSVIDFTVKQLNAKLGKSLSAKLLCDSCSILELECTRAQTLVSRVSIASRLEKIQYVPKMT